MFVAFEGIDGSGKTTVSNLVVADLQKQGLTVKHLRAEGKFVSSVSEAIRSLARDSRNVDLVPQAEFLLYVARDVQLIEEALREALYTHDVVVADRFLYTAEVLGRFGRGLSVDYMRPILKAAARDLSPDLVVLVDVDPTLARARRKASKVGAKEAKPPSRKGLAGVGLQHRVRRGYLTLAEENPQCWVTIKNEGILEDTVRNVSQLIASAAQKGARSAIADFRRLASGDAGTPVHEGALTTPEAARDALLSWIDERAEREPQVAAYVLGGLFGPEIDERRKQLAERVPQVVLSGLSGLVDDTSWWLRERLMAEYPALVVRSLTGEAGRDPRASLYRDRLHEKAPRETLRTLVRSDSDEAWELRDRYYESHSAAVMTSVAGVAAPRADTLREQWFREHKRQLADSYELSRVAARSVHGLDHSLAWKLRDAARAAAPVASLASISGLSCERSWELRDHYLLRASKVVMQTLRGMRDEHAFRMRAQVAADVKEAIDSIARLDDDQAWQLRQTYRDVWPSTVVKSLGPLAGGEQGRALILRQLSRHPNNVSLLKHVTATLQADQNDVDLDD